MQTRSSSGRRLRRSGTASTPSITRKQAVRKKSNSKCTGPRKSPFKSPLHYTFETIVKKRHVGHPAYVDVRKDIWERIAKPRLPIQLKYEAKVWNLEYVGESRKKYFDIKTFVHEIGIQRGDTLKFTVDKLTEWELVMRVVVRRKGSDAFDDTPASVWDEVMELEDWAREVCLMKVGFTKEAPAELD